jgi:hypothetical protein
VDGAQLPWLDVLDDDDGVAAVADELLELELLELVDELVDVLDFVDVPLLDFVDVPLLVVLDALAFPVAVVAAMAPVNASIPATLAAPTTRRVRRAGCGRFRLRVGRGSVSFGI